MALPKYTPTKRKQVASELGIDEQYLYQILRGLRFPSPLLARKLNKADEKMRLQDLRPGDWKAIWPELKSSKKSQANKV